jgi:hypothetical protein
MHRTPVGLFLSVFVGAAIIAAVAVGTVMILRDGDEGSATTLLANRIESARQIRQALARPIPPPEPLGPITAKLAHPRIQSADEAETKVPKLSRGARDAMAREDRPPSSRRNTDSNFSYATRSGTGGW